MMAAIISFSCAKIQIRFGYFFYVNTSNEIEEHDEEEENEISRARKRMKKILNVMIYANFLSPVIVLMMFINPLSKDILVPDYLSSEMFVFQKIFFVLAACFIRAFTFREEC